MNVNLKELFRPEWKINIEAEPIGMPIVFITPTGYEYGYVEYIGDDGVSLIVVDSQNLMHYCEIVCVSSHGDYIISRGVKEHSLGIKREDLPHPVECNQDIAIGVARAVWKMTHLLTKKE